MDGFGARASSAVFSFFTDNQNAIPGIIRGVVRSDRGLARLAAASVQVGAGQVAIAGPRGEYYLLVLPGSVDVSASAAGFLASSAVPVAGPIGVVISIERTATSRLAS